MSWSSVLIPLDGSPQSERAIALLAALPDLVAAVTLLRVVPSEDEAGEAAGYLADVAAGMTQEASTLVRVDEDPAEQILREVEAGDFGLVALTTHAHGGLKRWVWGSVAEHLIRQCPVPLLVGTPEGGVEAPTRRVLVPLDGSDLAVEVLSMVRALAGSAEAVLFSAIWVDGHHNHVALNRALDAEEAQCEQHLAAAAETLASTGMQVSTLTKPGSAAGAILDAVAETGAGLIAMSTHGRTGVGRWLLGSVAERVLRASPVPVLLLRSSR